MSGSSVAGSAGRRGCKDFITPTDDVHVLAHLGVARVDRRQWRLRVDGIVARPFGLGHDELLGLPVRDLTAVFECYGNPLDPDVPARSVANVVWRGVPLTELLARAGVGAEATVVCFEGLDFWDVRRHLLRALREGHPDDPGAPG
jgi:DMSO/TMAO reductase YedYZ molybdopterin-dependent catalytic subunit